MQVFLDQPWQQMRASLIILFGKTKALFGKDAARKKCIIIIIFCIHYTMSCNEKNERETSEQK